MVTWLSYPTLTLILIFSMSYAAFAHVDATTKSCRASPVKSLAREDRCYQNSLPQDRFLKQLQQESLQKVEALQEDSIFQETVKVLHRNLSQPQNIKVNSSSKTQGNLKETNLNQANLYIFVSFSMGEKALLNLAYEAKQFGATLVLRGFKEGSYKKTAHSLMKIIIKTGIGVLIDPELYELFDITAVPTFILARPFQLLAQERTQTPIHDKLQGHVSTHYALEQFAKDGDLKEEASHLLQRRRIL